MHFISIPNCPFALSKILPHPKTIKNGKKLSLFIKTTFIVYLNFYKIMLLEIFIVCRTYNQTNYRNI